jgi:outer membrane receptor protein involved in Fe transport
MLGILFGAWAPSVRASTQLAADIRPEPLAQALAEFAHAARLQVIYVSVTVGERTSPGAHAGSSATEALQSLLEGTGLSFVFLNARTVRIVETGVAAPSAQSHATALQKPAVERAAVANRREVIIVTGSRSVVGFGASEDIRSVPASVGIVSGGTLEAQKVEQLSDYAAYVPGVAGGSFGSPGFSYVVLRGVYPFTDAATGAYYVDDAPLGANGNWGQACCVVADLMPYDLERLEVRRGPQGTRFGANSESGVIRYVLREPDVSEFQARVGADSSAIHGASGAGASLRGMVNVPVVKDELAVRLSAYDSYTPGYIDNAYTGARDLNAVHQSGARLALLWLPAPSLAVKFNALWPRNDTESESSVSSTGVENVTGSGDANIVKATGYYGDLKAYHAFKEPLRESIDYYAATVDWNPGSLEIVSASAWSRTDSQENADNTLFLAASFPEWSDGAIAPGLATWRRNTGLEKFTEELHVESSHEDRIAWLLGGFYTHESGIDEIGQYAFDKNYQPIAVFAPALTTSRWQNTFVEWAAFGELTWHVTDQIDLAGGLRYSHNRQRFAHSEGGSVVDAWSESGQWQQGLTNWMVAANYRFTRDVMLYGRAATGSQPGFPTGAVLSGLPSPETVTNYEAGLKSEWLDHKARLDLSVFYVNCADIQGLQDGAKAASQGFELTASYAPLPGLALEYVAAYTKAELLPGIENPLPGYQLADIPKWSMALTTNYDWSLTDAWLAHVGGALRWVDKRWSWLGVGSRAIGWFPTNELPPYTVVDLNASVARGPLTLRTFVRNLTDTRAKTTGIVQGDVANPPASLEERILQPRSIGVGFDYAF